MKNYLLAFKNIFNYSGEATLNEFWTFFGINFIVNIIVTIICKKLNLDDYVYKTYRIISIFAFVSIGFRRLKNAGLSGWLFLIPLANLLFASYPEKKEAN